MNSFKQTNTNICFPAEYEFILQEPEVLWVYKKSILTCLVYTALDKYWILYISLFRERDYYLLRNRFLKCISTNKHMFVICFRHGSCYTKKRETCLKSIQNTSLFCRHSLFFHNSSSESQQGAFSAAELISGPAASSTDFTSKTGFKGF